MWNAVPGAASYDVQMWDGGPFWRIVATEVSGTTYTRVGLTGASTDMFAARGRNATGVSQWSKAEAATTHGGGSLFAFIDDPLISGVTVVKGHLTGLRAAVNTSRTRAGLGPFAFTDPTITVGTPGVRAVHVEELRQALAGAWSARGLPALGYTDSTLAGAPVRAAHIQELRDALK